MRYARGSTAIRSQDAPATVTVHQHSYARTVLQKHSSARAVNSKQRAHSYVLSGCSYNSDSAAAQLCVHSLAAAQQCANGEPSIAARGREAMCSQDARTTVTVQQHSYACTVLQRGSRTRTNRAVK